MANEIQVIKEQIVLGQDFKIYGTVDEPLFLAKDVAEWINYDCNKVGQMISTIDDDEKLTTTIYRSGQNREMWFLTEDGLYEVLMQSRKPIAKQFKKEVKSILRTLRNTGGYITNSDLFINAYFSNIPEEQRILVKGLIQNVEEQQKIISKQKPLVEFAEHIQQSDDSIDMKEMAKLASKKGIKIGRNKLFEFLRLNDVLMKDNEPYQSYMEREWFEVIESTYKHWDGSTKITKTTLVKPKGQSGIVKMLKCFYNM